MSRPSGLESVTDMKSDSSGLGLFSLSTVNSRNRAMTIEDFSISSVESTKPQHPLHIPDIDSDTALSTDWETVSWIFSDILQSISAKEKENLPAVLTKCQQLVKLLADNPQLKHEIVIENVLSRILFMIYDLKPLLRSTAYRILRHTLAGRETVAQLVQQRLLLSLTISLSSQCPLIEKQESLKLLRTIIAIPEGASLLNVGVVKALVVLAEHEIEESSPYSLELRSTRSSYSYASGSSISLFCKMCIESICELLMSNPEVVFHSGGLRLLINLTMSATPDISSAAIMTLITMLDHPDSRFLLRGGSDLDSLFSIFNLFEDNDSVSDGNENAKLHKKAMEMAFIISILMKSWTGILYFSHNNLSGLLMLLMSLKKKNVKLQAIILDLLLDILRIKALPWFEDSKSGLFMKRFSLFMKKSNHQTSAFKFEYSNPLPDTTEYNILAHNQGLIIKLLINCDIKNLLMGVINDERDEENTDKATKLLTHIFQLAVEYLPLEFYQKSLLVGSSVPLSTNSVLRIQSASCELLPGVPSSTKHTVKVSLKEMTQSHRIEISDTAFKSLMSNLKTTHLKEFIDWDWPALSHLFLGPIRNPQRFLEIQEKYPKLLKTFMSFLRPFKYRFVQIPLNATRKYPTLKNPKSIITITCQLLESLLTFEEGAHYLATNKLMPQLVEIVKQVDPYSSIIVDDPILSETRLKTTLSIGYVKILSKFTGSPRGIKILEQWGLLQLMNDLIDGSTMTESNNHLVFNLLNNLDYSFEMSVRQILAKALTMSNKKVKAFIMESVLPTLIQKNIDDNFVIELLVNVLSSTEEVLDCSTLQLLRTYFLSNGNTSRLERLIEMQPDADVLSQTEEGKAILHAICKTSPGFKYLHEVGYIDRRILECIKQLQSFEYLDQIENSIQLFCYPYLNIGQLRNLLRHFFHYLLSTEEGLTYFKQQRQLLDKILQTIRKLSVKLELIKEDSNPKTGRSLPSSMTLFSDYSLGSESGDYFDYLREDESRQSLRRTESNGTGIKWEFPADERDYNIKQLKQSMWVLGEISSAEYGFQLLDPSYSIFISEKHIAEVIVRIFETSSHWQFRGLAFYLLGMMAATEEGIEILDELNWISVEQNSRSPIFLAYPNSLNNGGLFNEKEEAEEECLNKRLEGVMRMASADSQEDSQLEGFHDVGGKILNLINHLSSILGRIERKAREELIRIKNERPIAFRSVGLFLKVVNLVDKGSFKYRVRLFIFGLFDCLEIVEELMKKKRKNSIIRR